MDTGQLHRGTIVVQAYDGEDGDGIPNRSITPDASIEEALKVMANNKTRRLPVVDETGCSGWSLLSMWQRRLRKRQDSRARESTLS